MPNISNRQLSVSDAGAAYSKPRKCPAKAAPATRLATASDRLDVNTRVLLPPVGAAVECQFDGTGWERGVVSRVDTAGMSQRFWVEYPPEGNPGAGWKEWEEPVVCTGPLQSQSLWRFAEPTAKTSDSGVGKVSDGGGVSAGDQSTRAHELGQLSNQDRKRARKMVTRFRAGHASSMPDLAAQPRNSLKVNMRVQHRNGPNTEELDGGAHSTQTDLVGGDESWFSGKVWSARPDQIQIDYDDVGVCVEGCHAKGDFDRASLRVCGHEKWAPILARAALQAGSLRLEGSPDHPDGATSGRWHGGLGTFAPRV